NVAESMQHTFSKRLGRRFDGKIGAAGGAYTYQGMGNFTSGFWSILRDNRVLVVFDEIHHCSGQGPLAANTWGQKILANIQDRARYTLALTGTPWRSDRAPIALARYSDTEGRIRCNYSYGLSRAVEEGVCRSPKIVLIDNQHLKLTDSRKTTRVFGSISDLLSDSDVSYDALLQNEA